MFLMSKQPIPLCDVYVRGYILLHFFLFLSEKSYYVKYIIRQCRLVKCFQRTARNCKFQRTARTACVHPLQKNCPNTFTTCMCPSSVTSFYPTITCGLAPLLPFYHKMLHRSFIILIQLWLLTCIVLSVKQTP